MSTKLEKLGVNTHKYRQATFLEIGKKLVCPICLKNKERWHVHHFVHKNQEDQGRDIKQNLVVICTFCHRTLHEGDLDDAMAYWAILRDFMWGKYGLVNLKKEILREVIKQTPSEDWSKLSTFRKWHIQLMEHCSNRYIGHMLLNYFDCQQIIKH